MNEEHERVDIEAIRANWGRGLHIQHQEMTTEARRKGYPRELIMLYVLNEIIKQAHSDIPALLREVEALRQRVERGDINLRLMLNMATNGLEYYEALSTDKVTRARKILNDIQRIEQAIARTEQEGVGETPTKQAGQAGE